MRSSLLITALMTCAACSFEPVSFSGTPDDGGDLPTHDMDAMDTRDMPTDVDMSPPTDAGPDVVDMPDDMPRDMPGDTTPDADMPDDIVDMPQDMLPDLPDTGRVLGQPCDNGAQCEDGLCKDFRGVGRVCTQACLERCANPEYVCFEGTCTPSQTCDDSMGPGMGNGPGCDGCAKCPDSSVCIDVEKNGALFKSCLCKPGFEGDGFSCLDVNECDLGSDTCDTNATCLNTIGGYECACMPGFEGDGRTCTAVDPCAMCGTNARCEQNLSGVSCVCNTGFEGDGLTCADVDECAQGTDMCDPNASCTNEVGSHTCACDPGYEGDGHACTDIDECAQGTHTCLAPATCTNTPGSFDCACPAGTLVQGQGCQLFDSCAQIKASFANLGDGTYYISSPQGPLEVYCDMTTDGGVGYTLVRFQNLSLGPTQSAYATMCAQYGLELVVPQTPSHLDAITAWNGSPPNIVGVRPQISGAAGISNWEGECQGMSCPFHMTSRETTRCRTLTGTLLPGDPGKWSDGSFARSCQEYQTDAAQGAVNGVYQVDVDGPGRLAPFLTFCDMTTDGGGWTLGAMVSDDGDDTWTWNSRALWTTDARDVGSLAGWSGASLQDYKNKTIHEMPFRDLLFMHSPSSDWASYHGVSNNVSTLAQVITNTALPNCNPASGYPMTAGTIAAGGNLCSTSLYFNIGDYDGASFNCPTLFGIFDQSTFGPAWSIGRDNGCPFDDPARGAWGANFDDKNSESNAMGFGRALGLNVGASDAGINALAVSLREDRVVEPSGQNMSDEYLILVDTPTGGAGPSCPNGSFEDRGDQVIHQGYVVCAANGR